MKWVLSATIRKIRPGNAHEQWDWGIISRDLGRKFASLDLELTLSLNNLTKALFRWGKPRDKQMGTLTKTQINSEE